MRRKPSLGRTTLAFSVGALGLGSPFVLIAVTAAIRAHTFGGVPAGDSRMAAGIVLLLISGFAAVLAAAQLATLPIPSARPGFFAGLAGVALLIATMMLIGEPLGMRGALAVALLAGIASGIGAIRMAVPRHVQPARI